MFCERCGMQLADDEKSCQNCGWSNSEDISKIDEDYNDFRETTSFQGNIPNEETKNSQKKIGMIVGIVVVALVIIIGGIVIGVKQYDAYKLEQYHASDEYKILTAEEEILKGNYEKALTYLQSVDSESANAMKQYISVLEARDAFIEEFDETKLVTANNNQIYEKAEQLRAELREFEEGGRSYFLSAKLNEQYSYYKEKLEEIDEAFDSSNFYDNVYSAQLVLLNDVNRNQGQRYTLQEMQTIANNSRAALTRLKDFYSQYAGIGNENIIVKAKATELFYELYNELTDCVYDEIITETILIEEGEKDFDMNTKLHLKTPDESISYYSVHPRLEIINDYDDMYTNASIMVHTGKIQTLAYYIIAQDVERFPEHAYLIQ